MATVKAFIRVSKKKSQTAKIRFRLSDGRNKQVFHSSERFIDPNIWDAKTELIKAKVKYDIEKRREFSDFITDRKKLILEIYSQMIGKATITSKALDEAIDRRLHPERYTSTPEEEILPQSFFDLYDLFLKERGGTDRLNQHYKAVKRIMMRFELYIRKTKPRFEITPDTVSGETLRQLDAFIQEEVNLYKNNKDIYEAVPDSRPPKPRGQNRRNKIFRYIRTFYRWLIQNEYTENNPFLRFKIREDQVGTPIYISITERNKLLEFDLSDYHKLSVQRDIFVFQCLIGCRVEKPVKVTTPLRFKLTTCAGVN